MPTLYPALWSFLSLCSLASARPHASRMKRSAAITRFIQILPLARVATQTLCRHVGAFNLPAWRQQNVHYLTSTLTAPKTEKNNASPTTDAPPSKAFGTADGNRCVLCSQ